MSWLERLANAWGADASAPSERRAAGDPERVREVEAVLAELRPSIRADAGDIVLESVEDGWIVVRLSGSCASCHSSDLTVHGALEPRLKERLSWVRGVRTG